MTRTSHKTGHKTGLNAEALCRLALRLKFYRIVATRYKTPMGEIDIVAARGRTLVAVEVKARPTHADAAESVSMNQRTRIARALEDFVMRHPHYARYILRFDVMLAAPKRWPLHLTNAWRAE
ncbi:MAG: YraN family protein [Alphaproteobacteria bacterium]|nr:YraN family protein [Alphaproteobacteria bacterium]